MMNYNRSPFFGSRCFDSGFFSNGWNWLIGIGIILIIAVGIYLLANRNKSTAAYHSAVEALKLRYAQGEMSEEEYKKRKSILEGK